MSIHLMSKVWTKQVSGNTQTILLVLCDYANDDGVCWPSQAAVAWKAGCTDRTIRNVLRDLEALGAIRTLEPGRGRGHTSTIQINLDALTDKPEMVSAFVQENRKYETPKPEIGVIKPEINDAKPERAVSEEPSVEPPKKPSGRTTISYTSDFESWWLRWPKKGDTKKTAFDAWKRLGASERDLAVAGLTTWLPEYLRRENKFIPDASTWLNQRRWENEPPPPERHPVPMRRNGRPTVRELVELANQTYVSPEEKAAQRQKE